MTRRLRSLGRIIGLLAVLAAVALIWAKGQAEQLPLRSYSTSDGLAHDRVNKIVRDSHGFLWFCTSEGLSRFDGSEFKNYGQIDGLPHRSVRDLLQTRAGQYWIATGDGLVRFDPRGKSKTHSASSIVSETSAPMFLTVRWPDTVDKSEPASIQRLLEDRNGIIWVATSNGLFQLKEAGQTELLRFEPLSAAVKKRVDCLSLMEDRNGSIWVGTQLGLFRILPDRSAVDLMASVVKIQSLLQDRDGRIWAGCAGGVGETAGLRVFVYREAKPELSQIYWQRDGLSSDQWINALLETADGRILVGLGEDLAEFSPQPDQTRPQFKTLVKEGVVALAEDAGGNVWYSTNSSGVKRLASHGFVRYDESDGLTGPVIASVISAYNGDVYVLTGASALHRFNGKGFDAVTPRGVIARSWSRGQIAFPDHSGAWWINGATGLQSYPANTRFEDLAHTSPVRTYTTKDGLFADEVFQIFEDSRHDLWFSVIGDIVDTLMRWERATGFFHRYTTAEGLPPQNGATAFAEDRSGNIWIGFYSGGLIRYRQGKFEAFNAADGLPSGSISQIYLDRGGRIWVASSSGGAIRIDEPTAEGKPRLINLTTREGLSSNQASCITEDDQGHIYIGGGRGVNRLDLSTGRIKVFTKADGLPENIVGICRRDGTGALWFGTAKGLARYVPIAESAVAPPPVYLSELRANGIPARRLSELGETSVPNVELASDQRQIQVEFFGISFESGETLRYQYRLNQAEWSEPSTQRSVSLNLTPGSYAFEVRAVNAEGATSASPATMSLTIARPVWQRWWFLALVSIALFLLIQGIYRYRLRRLVELEKVRTRIAADLHDDIGASLSQIAILSEVARQNVAADRVEGRSLNQIAENSREMVDSMSDIVWAINPDRDHLSDLLQRMRNLAGEVTELADIGLRVQMEGIGDRDLSVGTDLRREVYLIFKETLNNAVRHSGCERVEIEFARRQEHLEISIKDDGRGFDVDARINGAEPHSGRGGNGLKNMRRRAESLGGTYEIVSEPGHGTIVTIRIPERSRSGWKSISRIFRLRG